MDSRFQLAQTPFACLRWLERNEVHWAGKRCCCQPPARQTACLPAGGGSGPWSATRFRVWNQGMSTYFIDIDNKARS